MGTVYIFRGKAASGKTTLADMLARKLSIPVFRKDDVVDALKMTKDTNKELVNNEVCYNILYKMIQTNLDINCDFIIDTIPADRNNAKFFLDRLDVKNNKVFRFLIDCSDENEWRRRHIERLKNPLPHEAFKSLEHVIEHYNKFDITPFDGEYVVDTAYPVEKCFDDIVKIIRN